LVLPDAGRSTARLNCHLAKNIETEIHKTYTHEMDLSSFLDGEKCRAQERIRKCEVFANDPQLRSDSVREGLMSLLRNAEDDYSTLLHLERVLSMNTSAVNHQDAVNISFQFDTSRNNTTTNNFTLNNSSESLTESFIRRQLESTELEPSHNGSGLSMDHSSSDQFNRSSADHGDVLDDLFEEGRRPRPLSGGHPGETHHHRSRQPLPRPPAADQLDEEESEGNLDEEEDSNNGIGMSSVSGGRMIGGARRGIVPRTHEIAHSLPVSIPMPDIKGGGAKPVLDFASDLEDVEEDEEGEGAGDRKRHLPSRNTNTNDIPKKIAEIARSLYDTSDTLPCSPSKLANRKF